MHGAVRTRVGDALLAPGHDVVVPTSTTPVALAIDGTLVDLTDGGAFARLPSAATLTAYTVSQRGLVLPLPKLGDCNRYDERDRAQTGIDANEVVVDEYKALRLAARFHSSCASFPIASARGGDVVRVAYEQRAVQGAAPRSCLWQVGVDRCAPLAFSATKVGDWYRMSALYRVPKDVTRLYLYVYADQPAPSTVATTEAWYRNVDLERLVPEASATAPEIGAATGTITLPADPVSVVSSIDVPAPQLADTWRLEDCNRTSAMTLEATGIRMVPFRSSDPRDVRLSADHHSGCVSMPIDGMEQAVAYEVQFDATVVRGSAPRMCLWQAARGACAPFAPTEEPRSGSGSFVFRGRLQSDAGGVQLFLYADAADHPTTIDYRNVTVLPVVDDALVLTSQHGAPQPAPPATWHEEDPAHYRVGVRDVTRPFVLTFSEAYAAGWKLHGLPNGARAIHVELDGYRNGWAIDAHGDLDLTLEYAPARLGHAAMRVSVATAVFLLASVLFAPAARRGRRRWIRWRAARSRERDALGSRRVRLPDDWRVPGT
jgi:hypothetical protein